MRRRTQTPAPEPIAVRIPQAAAMIGIGRSTLYLFIAAGEVETVKAGRATLVLVESLKAFIRVRRAEPAESTDES
ncbi:MAG TPA: helix-turn-helix domain-containing protein [Allosphingosinicella sp.]